MVYAEWRDPKIGAFALRPGTTGRSCDNHILFTVEAVELGLLPRTEAIDIIHEFFDFKKQCLRRYPGSTDYTSFDDHLAAAVLHPLFAKWIYVWGEKNGWKFAGNWLGRIPLFAPTVKAAAGYGMNLWDHTKAAVAYVGNYFEHDKATSGRLLLWLASKKIGNTWYVKVWKASMVKKFPNGVKDIIKIYFKDQSHPFHEHAPTEF